MIKLFKFVFASAMALTLFAFPMTSQAAVCQVTVNGGTVTGSNGQEVDINELLSKLGLNKDCVKGVTCVQGTDCVNGSGCVNGADCAEGADCVNGATCVEGADCLNGLNGLKQVILVKNCK